MRLIRLKTIPKTTAEAVWAGKKGNIKTTNVSLYHKKTIPGIHVV